MPCFTSAVHGSNVGTFQTTRLTLFIPITRWCSSHHVDLYPHETPLGQQKAAASEKALGELGEAKSFFSFRLQELHVW